MEHILGTLCSVREVTLTKNRKITSLSFVARVANLETLIVDQRLRFAPHDAAESLGHCKECGTLASMNAQFTTTDLLQIVQQTPRVQHLNIEGCALLDPEDFSCVLKSLPVLSVIAIVITPAQHRGNLWLPVLLKYPSVHYGVALRETLNPGQRHELSVTRSENDVP